MVTSEWFSDKIRKMVKNETHITRFIVLSSVLSFSISAGCGEDTSRDTAGETDTSYRYRAETTYDDYETETLETAVPDVPGWFPNDDIYFIPEETFDRTRSGHPWLAVATLGYVEIRNAPGYGAPPVTDSDTDDIPNDEPGETDNETKIAPNYYPNHGSAITGSLKRAEPFWITGKTLSEASGYHWYKIESFQGKNGFVYLPRTESYQSRAFAHEKIVPQRIIVYSADASFYDSLGVPIAPARYGDIFACKDLEIILGELYYSIMIPDFGDALIPVADCAVLAEDIFYVLYLSNSKIYDYPGQFNKLEEVLRYFARVEWFLARYPESINAPMVLYRANYVALAQGSSEKAKEYRKRLIENYPDEAKRLLNPDVKS